MPTKQYLNVTSNTEQHLVKVAIQKPTGGYTYKDILELVEQDQHYYEIIGSTPIKPSFDIDVKVGEIGFNDFNIHYYCTDY